MDVDFPQRSKSTAQHADHLAREAQAFGHHRDYIAEQRLVQRAVLGFEALVSLEAEGVEHAVQLGLNGGAVHLPGNEPISPIVVCGPRLRTRTERPSSNLTMM